MQNKCRDKRKIANILDIVYLNLMRLNCSLANVEGDGENLLQECPNGWHKFKNKCFQLFNLEVVAEEAFNSCKAHQAQLATIHSREEEAFLENLIEPKKSYRIGLFPTTYKPNSVVWIDGTPVDYINWIPGVDPNKLSTNCVWIALSKGKWNPPEVSRWHDDECTMKMHYICEQKLGVQRKFKIEKFPENNLIEVLMVNQVNLMDEMHQFKNKIKSYYSNENYCKYESGQTIDFDPQEQLYHQQEQRQPQTGQQTQTGPLYLRN
ncbi:macrophage mannose receptor 1-like protein [Dinothrombium tinctorium]|uniref:Macrophage mannose receptor 1-like protein n=1 Tax=Dinothrombium tinctorium TaxID=1965070 RepID=A0A3S3NV40_9ACAR|nr:macrophage mannose receptor 1-like protein [Dinothrombium tinctorium]